MEYAFGGAAAILYILAWALGATMAILITVAPLFIWKFTRKLFDEVSALQLIIRGMDRREKLLNEAVMELRFAVKNMESENQARNVQTVQYQNAICEALSAIVQNGSAPASA